MEKISVIVPVRNGEAWIQTCINSILQQSWTNLELLVIDDGSEDQTAALIEDLVSKDSRIRLIRQAKRGVSFCRNQGISLASGKYLTFVDADDKIEKQMLRKMAFCLEKECSDIVLCDYCRWNGEEDGENGRTEIKGVSMGSENMNSLKTVNKKVYISDYLLRGYTRCWSVLYRREAIGEIRFREDLTIGEDMMFLMDLLPGLKKISITDYKGYFYRINPQGAMLRPFVPAYMDEIKAWKLARDRILAEYPQQEARVSSILAVSAILVAGKLARLDAKQRRQYRTYVQECRSVVRAALKIKGAAKELPAGYGIKTKLFLFWPEGYLKLYHIWKK